MKDTFFFRAYLLIMMLLNLIILRGYSQSFPNIDLSQVPQSCLVNSTGTQQLINQFACQSNDDCTTAPWFVSHGSPDIVGGVSSGNKYLFAGSAIRSFNGASESHNEGLAYRQTFIKDKWYKINITYFLDAQKFSILLANGVPIAPCLVSTRSFSIPNVSDNQLILKDESPSGSIFK